jgi:hypothetical protein
MLMVVACNSCTLMLSASTTLFSFNLISFISKSYSLRNSNHLLLLEFRVGCPNKYLKPLWSIHNLNIFPMRYFLHIFKACTIASNSKSSVA